jgi:hypothetical protein
MLLRQRIRFTGPAPLGLFLSLAALGGTEAQAPVGRIPMGTGATIVQTLSTANADRESVHRVRLAFRMARSRGGRATGAWSWCATARPPDEARRTRWFPSSLSER